MKKKTWILLAATAVVCGVAILIWRENSKYIKPEVLEPEVFEDVNFDTDLLIGLWNENTNYYRYNSDGTAVTWDVADDLTEEEGVKMKWEINHNIFTHYYIMEIGGVIPKMYNLKVLELDALEYYDNYGVNHKLSKVDELHLIN